MNRLLGTLHLADTGETSSSSIVGYDPSQFLDG